MKKAILFFILVALVVTALGLGLPTRPPAQAAGSVEYLGQGGRHELGQGVFVVKSGNEFFTAPGPVYHAKDRDHVWASQIGGPEAVIRREADLGQVPAGCRVTYTAIDDDPDDRANTFMIDGQPIHTMGQGMVTTGEFAAPAAGHLTLQARDSIGLWVGTCPIIDDTPGPPATIAPSPSPTMVATATRPPTQTPAPSPTSPGPDLATATPGATATAAAEASPSPMPSATRPPAATATMAPSPTIVPTKGPRLPACTRINFEVAGHYAKPGAYVLSEVWGRVLHVWHTDKAGQQDSGAWVGFDITYPAVWVTVTYHPGNGGPPIDMAILNHAPDLPWGWVARGMCHAIEVGWPAP